MIELPNAFNFPILSLICYLPLVGVILIFMINKKNNETVKWVANIVAFLDFVISLFLLARFDHSTHAMQFIERVPWIRSIGVEYHFGIDGISLLLVLLTTLLGFISILSSWTAIKERVKEYYIFMLLLQTGMLGVFMALDFFLFYVFWEVMLVPMYFLIGVWGGPRKLYAAIKFFLYTLFGSVLMLIGILALYFINHGASGVWTFDILTFHELGNILSETQQWWIFLAFFVGFASLRCRRLRRRYFPSHDPCLFQSPALSGIGQRDSCHVGGAGHPLHGRTQETCPPDLLDIFYWNAGDRGHPALCRILQQG